MGSLLSSLFQIAIKVFPLPFPPCVSKWSLFPFFLRAPPSQVSSTQISVENTATNMPRYKRHPPAYSPLPRAEAIAGAKEKKQNSPCHIPGTNRSSPDRRQQWPKPSHSLTGQVVSPTKTLCMWDREKINGAGAAAQSWPLP